MLTQSLSTIYLESSLSPSSSTSCVIVEHDVVLAYDVTLENSDQLPQLCSLPVSCPPLAYSLQGGRIKWEKGKDFMLCKHCSAVAKTPVWYQNLSHKSKKNSPIQSSLEKANSIPTRPVQFRYPFSEKVVRATKREPGASLLWGKAEVAETVQHGEVWEGILSTLVNIERMGVKWMGPGFSQ